MKLRKTGRNRYSEKYILREGRERSDPPLFNREKVWFFGPAWTLFETDVGRMARVLIPISVVHAVGIVR